jgi:hypothetical protein
MGRLVCVAIGGSLNAYRVYGIMTRAGDEPAVRTGVVMRSSC